ncbi:hypothetical protein ZIOFF_033642 [Zingiber officinale]|uniref:CASP-like protein n=1 Tax=Zingiber officinale TaxID=94328 RepID=A0A8J5L6W5_ZINOF|nr:hypothetical protein ZIOFF_033642 [Zingiber officinale]
MDLHGVWELASPIKRAPPPATSGIQCHLLTSTTCTTCCATTNQTPTSRPQTPIRSISCSPSAEQSTIMKSTDEEGQQQRTQQGGDVAKAEDAGSGRVAETLLRVAPIGLCLAAMAVMLKNSQDGDFGSISYSDLAAFKFVFGVRERGLRGVLASVGVLRWHPSPIESVPVMFLTYIILAAGTVSTEMLYLAYKGSENVTWSKSCGIFDTFCRQATTSVVITFGSVVYRIKFHQQGLGLNKDNLQDLNRSLDNASKCRHMLKVSMNKMMKMIEAALEAHGEMIINLTLNKVVSEGDTACSTRGSDKSCPQLEAKESTLPK